MLVTKFKQLLNHEGFKKYFYNSFWLVGEKVIRLITGLFVSLYVARYLGPINFGILNYSISFVALFAVIAPLGLDEIVINELLKYPDKRDIILGTAFRLKLAGTLITILLLCTTFLFPINDNKTKIYILIISLNLFFQPLYVIDLFFQSKVQAKFLVQSNILSIIINSVIRIVLIIIRAPLIFFVWVSVTDSLIIAFGLLFFYKKQNLNIKHWRYIYSFGNKLLKQSWPLIFSGFVIMVYMRIDQVMIKQMVDFKSVGVFSVAVKLTELWYFIPMAIGSSFFPAVINSKNTNASQYYERLSNLMSLMVTVALLISIPTFFLSKFIVNTLYGLEYIEAAPVLNIYIWASVFVFLGVASSKWFIIENLNRIALYRCLMGAIVNVFLNLFLIPRYGIIGAAISTVISQFIQTYLSNLFFYKTRKLFFIQTRALFLVSSFKFVKKYI
jgi:O-antigen/teichoic acid export membrane protein